MHITIFFTKEDIPITILTPIINIINLTTGATAVNNGEMEHRGFGIYTYDMSSFYDNSQEYAWVCDGGIEVDNRWSFGVNDFVNIAEMSDELDDSSGSI